MQRPVMNPMPDLSPRQPLWWRMLKRIVKVLLSRPLSNGMVEDVTLRRRIFRGALYRLSLIPPTAMLAAAMLVYIRTHPAAPPVGPDPLSDGVYFEPVSLIAEDHVRLDGWLAPALDARQVIADGNKTLKQRWPAVVLVHGFGMSPQQVLPLFLPLHEHGFVVLAIALRGTGSLAAAGQTFGLNEAMDVKAAVESLRRRPYVDGSRIAVVGIGSGANAALLTADKDPALAALVLDDPEGTGNEAVAAHVVGGPGVLSWLDPLCQWVFAIGYGLDVRDLDLDQYGRAMAARPTLLMRWSADAESALPSQRVNQIVDFLDNSLAPPRQQADGAGY